MRIEYPFRGGRVARQEWYQEKHKEVERRALTTFDSALTYRSLFLSYPNAARRSLPSTYPGSAGVQGLHGREVNFRHFPPVLAYKSATFGQLTRFHQAPTKSARRFWYLR